MPGTREEENDLDNTSSKRIKLEERDSKPTLTLILEKEIRNEINLRRNDLETIEQRIYQTRQSLLKVRQGIVSEFYRQNFKGILQIPPHPAVTGTFQGKCPSNKTDSYLIDALSQNVSNNVMPSVNLPEDINGYESGDIDKNQTQLSKFPRYIPPKYREKDVVQSCEPRGNVKKKKFRVTIRNVSKWIFDKEQSKGATHKWTVYVKNSDPQIDISSVISKVTFFLHHSYKPNDVITVEYPPFKLTRRGWGEFPLRIQLHFVNKLDKSVDVIHLLKLDTTHSGLDTFGAETVVDLWAHCSENNADTHELATYNLKEEVISSSSSHNVSLSSLSSLVSKPTTYLSSEDFLSTSSFSQHTIPILPTEISNDILSEIFGDDDIKIKEVIEDNVISSSDLLEDNSSLSLKNVNPLESIKEEYESGFKYTNILEECSKTAANVEAATAEKRFQTIYSEGNKYLSLNQQQPNEYLDSSVTTSHDKQSASETLSFDEFANEEVFSNMLEENSLTNISASTSSPEITYNPAECLNYVNSEVIIKSEEEEDDEQIKSENLIKIQNTNNLSCKDLLENFIDNEILKPEVQLIKEEITVSTSSDCDLNSSEKETKQIKKHDHENKFSDLKSTTNSVREVKKLPIVENIIITNNSACLNNKIPLNMNKQCLINLSHIENVVMANNKSCSSNKLIKKDLNDIKKVVVSPTKNENLHDSNIKIENNKSNSLNNVIKNIIDKCSPKNKLILNKNSGNDAIRTTPGSILLNHVKINLQSNSKNTINNTAAIRKKLFIEMPDGQLKEICSASPSTSKPIIIERPQIVNSKRKISFITKSQNNSPIKLDSSMKKIILEPGYQLVPSNKTNFKLNGQTKQKVLPIKTFQNNKQSLLKAPSSSLLIAKPSTSSANSSQYIKIVSANPSALDNRNIVIQRKVLPGESLLKKGINSQQADTKNLQETSLCGLLNDKELIKRCPSESVEFAVNWLIKQFPVVNGRAGIDSYKRKHPYCAVGRNTFLKWPLAKQRAAEWMRAKIIGKLLENICPNLEKWTTLQIIDWARLRGYTPLAIPLRCNNLSPVKKDMSFLFTTPDLSSLLGRKEQIIEKETIIADSDQGSEMTTNIETTTSVDRVYLPLDKKLRGMGDFIFKSCDNLGIHFYEEELTPGVIYPVVERVLISAFHSVADDLFRRSLNASCFRNNSMPATEINVDDVKMAILSRSEFDIFTNEGLGSQSNE